MLLHVIKIRFMSKTIFVFLISISVFCAYRPTKNRDQQIDIFKSTKINRISLYCQCLRFGKNYYSDTINLLRNFPCQYYTDVKNWYLITPELFKYSIPYNKNFDSLQLILREYVEILDNDSSKFNFDLRLALLIQGKNGKYDTLNYIKPNVLLINNRYFLKYKDDVRDQLIKACGDSLMKVCF